MACKFFEMLDRRWNSGARVCIGLDSDPQKIPDPFKHPTGYGSVDLFNRQVIEATAELALAYKPNIAFYSGKYVPRSLEVLYDTVAHIHKIAPDVPVILDAKRADIGNTNAGYVDEAFVSFNADAVTVNPYFGMEAMKPFLEQRDKGILVLCKTSNPGSGEFQDITLMATDPPNRSMQMYEYVAHRVANRWNSNNNCALVVGATYPEELGRVRNIIGDDMWILIPGIGTQGGDLEGSVRNGINSRKRGIIINSSSGIIFAKDPRANTQNLTDAINVALQKTGHVVDKLA